MCTFDISNAPLTKVDFCCLQFLLSAVAASNLPEILCALAHGGKINSSSSTDKAPILLAIEAVSQSTYMYMYNYYPYINNIIIIAQFCIKMSSVVSLLKNL